MPHVCWSKVLLMTTNILHSVNKCLLYLTWRSNLVGNSVGCMQCRYFYAYCSFIQTKVKFLTPGFLIVLSTIFKNLNARYCLVILRYKIENMGFCPHFHLLPVLQFGSPYNRPPRAQKGSRGIALLILNLGARRGWEVSTTPRSLYPRDRPANHCTGGWVGPRADLDLCEKISSPPGFDPRTVQPVASCYT
jgi:hypothetical protein